MTPDHRQSNSFLRRNIAHVVHSLTNGTFGSPPPGLRQQSTVNGGDHPRKRRRVSSPDRSAVNLDHLIASPSKLEAGPTLSIELLKLSKRDSRKVRPQFDSVVTPEVTTKAYCRLTISEQSSGNDRTVYCDGQECEIVAFKNPAGPHRIARIHLEHPFYVPKKKLIILRRDDNEYDLADSYRLLVELNSTPDTTTWPPLDAQDLGVDDKLAEGSKWGHWRLEGQFNEIYGRHKAPVQLRDSSLDQDLSARTEYDMDVDLKWTTGFKTLRNLESGSKHCITAIDSDQPEQLNGHVDLIDVPMINGDMDHVASPQSPNPRDESFNGNITPSKSFRTRDLGDEAINGDATPTKRDYDDLMNGDVTPSRSLRTRGGDKNYNLKKLSDKAHGTQRRRRKPTVPAADQEGRVSYFLPSEQPLTLDFFRCLACGAFHQSLQLLQLHLGTHMDHEYELETTVNGPQFHVKVRPPSASVSQTFQLGRPTEEFKLESFLSDDHSWLQSRVGGESVLEFTGETTISRPPTALTTFKPPRATKQGTVSPQKAKSVKPTAASTSTHNGGKTIIPQSNYTFFHPVSKQELKAGDLVPFAPAEKSWLYHRHRESLNESNNLTAAELEYIKEFDASMQNHDISARAYFPRAWLYFVETRASWLVSAKHRMNEFALHQSYLIASQLLKDEHLDEAIVLIERARKARKEGTAINEPRDGERDDLYLGNQCRSPKPTPRTPPVRRSARGCGVCAMPVMCGPELLICTNQDCTQRLFHFECAPNRPSKSHIPVWVCENCA